LSSLHGVANRVPPHRLPRDRMRGPLVLALGLAAAGLACGESPPPKASPPDVVVGEARKEDVPVYSEWVGTATGFINAQIRARVRGYLETREYLEGSLVRKGQLLFRIDPRPYQAKLREAQGQLARAEAALTKTELDVARYTPLAAEGAVSQQELDNAIQANRANKAAVEVAEANVYDAELDLGWTRVRSPIDGIAGLAVAQVGDLIEASTLLTTVSQVDPIKVDFPISEQEYLRFARPIARALEDRAEGVPDRGPRLELVLADDQPFPHPGRVALPNREVDPTTGTIVVQGVFPNPDHILRPGQYGLVRAITRTLDDAVVVPQKAVIDLQGSLQVAVVKADDTVEIRAVEVGPKLGTDQVVTRGVQAGERIVVEGTQKVRAGMKVAPTPARSAAASSPPGSGTGEAAKPEPARPSGDSDPADEG